MQLASKCSVCSFIQCKIMNGLFEMLNIISRTFLLKCNAPCSIDCLHRENSECICSEKMNDIPHFVIIIKMNARLKKTNYSLFGRIEIQRKILCTASLFRIFWWSHLNMNWNLNSRTWDSNVWVVFIYLFTEIYSWLKISSDFPAFIMIF